VQNRSRRFFLSHPTGTPLTTMLTLIALFVLGMLAGEIWWQARNDKA
jgi:hypothetical protein